MHWRRQTLKTIVGSCITVLVLMCALVDAQWVKVPPANVPRTPDGKPDLSALPPRLPNRRPDLPGIWKPEKTYDGQPQHFAANRKGDKIRLRPSPQSVT